MTDPAMNLALEEYALRNLPLADGGILLFYINEPSIIIGKNQKDELLKALKLRNGCGHPNSLKVGSNMVAGHIELLLLNVFEQFGA